jgi:hypothetical protein
MWLVASHQCRLTDTVTNNVTSGKEKRHAHTSRIKASILGIQIGVLLLRNCFEIVVI